MNLIFALISLYIMIGVVFTGYQYDKVEKMITDKPDDETIEEVTAIVISIISWPFIILFLLGRSIKQRNIK